MSREATPEPARFHFDPGHDPVRAPTAEQIEIWVRRLMREPTGRLVEAVATLRRSRMLSTGLAGALLARLPLAGRAIRRRQDDQCARATLEGLGGFHDLMREYAVDLTTHPLALPALEASAALAMMSICERHLRLLHDRVRHRGGTGVEELGSILEQIDTTSRIEAHLASVRALLENEAVNALLSNDTLLSDRSRCLAALRAAREELTDEDIIGALDLVIEQADAATRGSR